MGEEAETPPEAERPAEPRPDRETPPEAEPRAEPGPEAPAAGPKARVGRLRGLRDTAGTLGDRIRWGAPGMYARRGGRGMRRLATTWRGRAVLALLVLGAAAAIAALATGPGGLGPPERRAGTRADANPYDGRSPRAPAGPRQRVLVELQRPPLGRVAGAAGLTADAQRDYVASLKREAQALRGALDARGVRLTEVVAFERAWNGFAATVRTRDLAAISSLGVRAQPVRRFYPAVSEPVPVSDAPTTADAPAPAGAPAVALLASGVAGPEAALAGPGYDAVDRDSDPAPGADPRDARRRETSGTALAGVLAASGARVRPIRIAGLQAGASAAQTEEYATSDQLLAGLERAVDADGDGDTSDRAAVALVGVSAPYAGFAGSPEAEAVDGARRLGTLVVAPAGGEGKARAPSGTVGSPGAARAAFAVGAFAADPPRAELRGESLILPDAAVLAGAPPRTVLPASEPVEATDPARLLRRGAPGLQGTLALVRAGADPGAQVAAAAAAGARAVLLAGPQDGRPVAAVSAGRAGVPVLGVSGAAGRAALEKLPGERVRFGPARLGPARRGARPSAFTSQGPTFDGVPKPDLAAAGAARTLGLDGRTAVAGGTAVAAARVAAEAARLAGEKPSAGPRELRAALTAAADPLDADGAPLRPAVAGAGGLERPKPGVTALSPLPEPFVLRPWRFGSFGKPFRYRGRLRLRGASDREVRRLTFSADIPPEGGMGARVTARGTLAVGGSPRGPGSYAVARLRATDRGGRQVLSAPFTVRPREAATVPVGEPQLTRGGDGVSGVRFTLGEFDRGTPYEQGTRFVPAERLELELIRPGGELVRRLTPPGGARELLPAEYAYTLDRRTLRRLGDGSFVFRVRARAPGQRKPTERRSPAFRR